MRIILIMRSKPVTLGPRRATVLATTAAAALVLSACGTAVAPGSAGSSNAASAPPPSSAQGATAAPSRTAAAGEGQTNEVSEPQPRLAVSHEGGIDIVDATTLKTIQTVPTSGFVRLNPAGDGRHVMVTEGDTWRVLDLGAWTKAHGDHGHSFTTTPRFTEQTFAGTKPGHVVHHVDKTVLFSDGTGEIQIFDPSRLGGAVQPETVVRKTPTAHHGVAIQLADGTLLHTLGTAEERNGVVAIDATGKELTRNEQCEGVHGEAASADHVVSFGCHDGALVYRDGQFTKVSSGEPHGSLGTLVGSENSPVVLADFEVHADANAEPTPPTKVSLIDTSKASLKVVDLKASYSFRSLERGPKGEAIVLTTDGALQVLDPATGATAASIKVIAPWTEPKEWQSPRPTVCVVGERAYVTEPTSKRVISVDLTTRAVSGSETLAHTPNEVVGTAG